jgi:hypothetical protein
VFVNNEDVCRNGKYYDNCTFANNSNSINDGAITFVYDGWINPDVTLSVRNCRFVGNASVGFGAAIFCEYEGGRMTAVIENCTFDANRGNYGGAIAAGPYCDLSVAQCTFVDNEAPHGSGILLYPHMSSLSIHNCIFARGSGGGGAISINTEYSVPESLVVSCSDIYDNGGGNWTGILGPYQGQYGNMSVDPLFCTNEESKYNLRVESPCAPGNNASGCLVGWGGPGCNSMVAVPEPGGEGGPVTRHWLSQNSPNPFNAGTTMAFALPIRESVRLEIFDVMGRGMRLLLNEELPGGQHEVRWDGRADDGRALPSGLYFCRMEAGSFRETRRMTLVK